jgi:hypothetical protein
MLSSANGALDQGLEAAARLVNPWRIAWRDSVLGLDPVLIAAVKAACS